MKYCAEINQIVKPKVTVNGDRVVQARIVNQVGEISRATVLIKPEDVIKYSTPDQRITINIDNVPGGGPIFTGLLSGTSFSNMNGNINAGLDVIHKARDLQETSSLVPGVSKAGNAEVDVLLYRKKTKVKDSAPSAYQDFDLTKPFPDAICDGINEWLKSVNPKGILPPSSAGDKAVAMGMISSIAKNSPEMGKFFEPGLRSRASQFITNILEKGHVSSDIWDVMSVIVGAFDATLVCMPDGTVKMTPNFCMIKNMGNKIPSEIIQKIDRSSQIRRSPKECLIMSSVTYDQVRNKPVKNPVGQYTDPNPGTRGNMFVAAPGWCNDLTSKKAADYAKKGMNALAKAMLNREAHKTRTFNVITPICPGAVPGTGAHFTPASGVKNFDGQQVDIFEENFDGYCYRVEHILDVESWTTIFSFQSCVEDSANISKDTKHPLFPDAKMIEWK
jgi:hypothetical protein